MGEGVAIDDSTETCDPAQAICGAPFGRMARAIPATGRDGPETTFSTDGNDDRRGVPGRPATSLLGRSTVGGISRRILGHHPRTFSVASSLFGTIEIVD
jgi:hypothetical protein